MNKRQNLAQKRHDKAGFTLLELLLVMVILSAVAFRMMSTVENEVSQVRYEDTRNRLKALRTAVMGSSNPALWAKGLQSGFVVDNGRLPENLRALVVRTNEMAFGAVAPIFDPTPNGQGFNDSIGETPLTNAVYRLMKGHRGAYVMGAIDQIYRDGWGTGGTSDFEENQGWQVEADGQQFGVASYGMDGQVGELIGDPYEVDLLMSPSISTNDWQVPLTATVTLRNLSGLPVTENLRVALLIYENRSSGGTWRQITSSLSLGSTPWNAAGEKTVTFPRAGATENRWVPSGEHVLVLLADNTDSSITDSILYTRAMSPRYITQRVKFYPRGGVPELVLEIR